MAAMLTSHGHEVAFYRRTTEGVRESAVGKIKGFLSGIYSPSGVRGMRDALRRERPDVVNVHNLYPFISPAALFECKKAGVPVVMTIHNFRLICPTGLFMRDGLPCEACLERGNEWSCVRYNCEYSRLKSIGYTLRNVYARWTGAYRKNVAAFACITDFQRQKLIAAGYDSEKIVVIPNFLPIPKLYENEVGKYVAFCGRISREKGVDLILEVARRNPYILFKLAGEVRDKGLVEDLPSNCELVGYLSGESLSRFYRESAFFVMASKWYEGFPMAILEAACYGKPTIGPAHGGFTEIIGRGEQTIGDLFEPNNLDDLERKVVSLWNRPDEIARLGEKAFEKLKREYSSEVIYQKWDNLFQKLV
jgi:glycosyltransferase involved in cell wall biosynthesis